MASDSTRRSRTLEVLCRHRIASILVILFMMVLILMSISSDFDTATSLWAHMRIAWRGWKHRTPLRQDLFYHCGLLDAASSDTDTHNSSTARPGQNETGIVANCNFPLTRSDSWATTCQDFPTPAFGSFSIMRIFSDECLTYSSRYASACWTNRTNDMVVPIRKNSSRQYQSHTAVVLRAYDDFEWTLDDIVNTRAMIAEVESLTVIGYSIHVLLHIKDAPEAQWRSENISREIALKSVPEEFHPITEYWTYADCEHAYGPVGEYDVYHHTFMPLQMFADKHAEYEHFWNWEMDVRYTSLYNDLFPNLAAWTRDQSDEDLWERNTRFYIESYHKSYENFTRSVVSSLSEPVPWIEVQTQHQPSSEADLITLFPMFDVAHTNWFHKDYLVGYNKNQVLPRFGTVGTNIRLSRVLLQLMADENRQGRSMMSEMWPPTLAFHHGLKAVYAPHPIFTKTQWSAADLQQNFNGGKDGRVGGAWTSIMNHEADFLETTWFWNAKWAGDLYARWMGTAKIGLGSAEWRQKHGPLCLPPMLLHPVKAAKLQDGA